MGGLLDRIEQKRAILVAAKEGAERARKDMRKVRCPQARCRGLLVWARDPRYGILSANCFSGWRILILIVGMLG